jgi:argininosuccinate lyase
MKPIDILRQEKLSPVPSEVADYTSSIKSDIYLVEPVIEVNKAHIVMLTKQKILGLGDAAAILKVLNELPPDMSLDPRMEDVHMQVEACVIEKLGEAVGGKLHVAKSRNDQVATAIRMALRMRLLEVIKILVELRKTFLVRCDKHLEALMPGYTHLQHAQPITIAHYLLAYHDAFKRDTRRLMDAFSRVNLSPMGAGAIATTSFKIDRKLVAELLGFDGLVENSVDAVSARDFVVEVLADLALIMTNLSRFGEEIVLWNTSEFSAVELPDEYVSTSSIMPQKRNPVVAELIRAKTANVYGDLMAVLTILKALPLSYNLDLQEVTPHLWSACEVTLSSLKAAVGLLKGLRFDSQRWFEAVSRDFSTATELADMLVREHNLAFRTAHVIVGKLIYKMISEGKDGKDLTPEMLSAAVAEVTGAEIQIDKEKFLRAFDPLESVKIKNRIGGPSPKEVLRMRNKRVKEISLNEGWCQMHLSSLKEANGLLHEMVSDLEVKGVGSQMP